MYFIKNMFKVTLEYKKGFHEILLRHTINIQNNCNKNTESNKKCVESLHKTVALSFFNLSNLVFV